MSDMEKTFSEGVKERLKRISAWSLPDDPTGRGWKPNEIRRTLYQPILELVSLLASFEGGYSDRMKELAQEIETAQEAAEGAQSTAEAAQETADGAQSAADRAQSTAEAAGGTAKRAQTSAEGAQETADRAAAELAELWDALERLAGSLGSGGLSATAAQALLDWMQAAGVIMEGLSAAVSGILAADLVYGTADEATGAEELITLEGVTAPSAADLPGLKKVFADALEAEDEGEEMPVDDILLSGGVLTIRALANEPSLAGGVLSIR